MNYTENLNLKKPEQNEFYDVDDFNNNADILDEQIQGIKNGYVKKAGDTMSGNLTVDNTEDNAGVAVSSASGSIAVNVPNNSKGTKTISATNAGGTPVDVVSVDKDNNITYAGGKVAGALIMTGANIAKSTNDGVLSFNGGKNADDGAILFVYGKDDAHNGKFILRANDGETHKDLEGTPTGSLKWSGNEIITSNGGILNGAIKTSVQDQLFKTEDGSYLALCGGTSWTIGAGLRLSSVGEEFNDGGFALHTRNDINLIGDTEGTLTWNNKNLVRSVNGVNADASGNVSILDLVYPIGSIYMSVNNVSPSVFIGGEWEALDEGRVLIGANSTYEAGSTGGEFNHKLTTEEMPSHNHTWSGTTSSNGSHGHSASSNSTGSHTHTVEIIHNSAAVQGASSGQPSGWVGNATTSSNGSHSHTITVNSNGAHTHTYSGTTSSNGSGNAHNNMQPYLSVYMWKRVA